MSWRPVFPTRPATAYLPAIEAAGCAAVALLRAARRERNSEPNRHFQAINLSHVWNGVVALKRFQPWAA